MINPTKLSAVAQVVNKAPQAAKSVNAALTNTLRQVEVVSVIKPEIKPKSNFVIKFAKKFVKIGEKLLGEGSKKAPAVSADKVAKWEKGFIEKGNYLFEA